MEIEKNEWKSEIENGTLRDWVEKLKVVCDESKWKLTEDGIYAKEVDPAHVCMVDTTLHREAFETFEDVGDTEILGELGVNLDKVVEQLEKFDARDILQLKVEIEYIEYDEEEKELIEMTDKEYLTELISNDEEYDTDLNKDLVIDGADEIGIDVESFVSENGEGVEQKLINDIPDGMIDGLVEYVVQKNEELSGRFVDVREEKEEIGDDTSNHLVISGEYRDRKMPLLDTAGMTEPNIPELDLPNDFTINIGTLSKIVGNSNAISDHITIEMGEGKTGEQLFMHSVEDEDILEATIPAEDLVSWHTEEDVRSLFALDYLHALVSTLPNKEDVSIHLGADYPMDMQVDSEEMNIRYLLAPRIESRGE